MKHKKVYIAGPFFNEAQLAIIEEIKQQLDSVGIKYFSPKDESMFKQGDAPDKILRLNCEAINSAPFVVVVTDDKDVGTMWEAGYAYAKKKPILYVWLGYKPWMKFNLMLGASGYAVHTYADMLYQICRFMEIGEFKDINSEGMLYE